jgi:hypothetical protein
MAGSNSTDHPTMNITTQVGNLDLGGSVSVVTMLRNRKTYSPPELLGQEGLGPSLDGIRNGVLNELRIPLLLKEGWLRRSRKCCEATAAGADGVVL